MKKHFQQPSVKLVAFKSADVISTSGQHNAPITIQSGQRYDEEDW